MIVDTDKLRTELAGYLGTERRVPLGQFLTPSTVANFMASLFHSGCSAKCRLLDAGAGAGALSAAFLERCARGDLAFQSIVADAFEIDEGLHPCLTRTLEEYARHLRLAARVHGGDFVHKAASALSNDLLASALPRYTHAILNPPYRKIRSDSAHRLALRRVGIETVNLYSAFVALALGLLDHGGQLVAIIPRSFCNGPYYRSFRKILLQRAALKHIHLFTSRDRTFRDDDVLQENVIILLEKGAPQGDVAVSGSADGCFSDYTVSRHHFASIVLRDDPERFIRVPNGDADNHAATVLKDAFSLCDLGIEVSTGPVVDFRLREHIRDMPEAGTVPLLYPAHFVSHRFEWPKRDSRKPNAIVRNGDTIKRLFPTGFYTVVRRFSSKEEKRRIVAGIVDPGAFPNASLLGFENHLNVFHCHRHGLPENVARGLAVFLSTSALDAHFRCFSGHTQVNATDLRRMKYPSRETLATLGEWAREHPDPDQSAIDAEVGALIA